MSLAANPRVLIVEDHAILTEALAAALRLEGFDELATLTGAALTVEQVVDEADRVKPDVVLLDLHLGEDRLGIPMIRPLVERGATVLMLTASKERELLAECLEAGASGLFDKAQPFDQLVEYVRDAAQGITVLKPMAREELLAELRTGRSRRLDRMAPFEQLTTREAEVLAALCDGRVAEEIAASQTLSVATVRSHIRAVLTKLGVNSQLAAVALARRAGWPEGE